MSCDSCLHGRNQGQCLIGRLGFPMIGAGCAKFVYWERLANEKPKA
jgi:hypothetical protein